MDLRRIVRILSVVSIAGGVLAIAMPLQVADAMGLAIEPGQGLGYGEIGALYGGNFVALGAIGLYACRQSVAAGAALLAAIGIIWLGFATGRLLVTWLSAQSPPGMLGWVSFIFELAVGLLFLSGARASASVQ